MRKIWKQWIDRGANGFIRSVGVLVGGTAFAQAIMVFALPIITRLYSPSDFSVLAVFTGLVSIISVAACLRFDVAIPIPEQDDDAANVLGLALLCAWIVSLMLVICVLVIPEGAMVWFHQPKLEPYLWLLPSAVMSSSFYSVFQFWFVRKRNFAIIAKNRIVQSCVGAGTQIGFGWLGYAPFGLIFGQILNNSIGCISLGYRCVRTEKKVLSAINWRGMRAVFSNYHRFPKYSTFEALSNSAGLQLPIIMIAAFATGPEAGYLALAMYAMQAPMGLISTAVSQVYLSRAPEEYRAERLGTFTTTVLGGLIKSGVGPLIFVSVVAPDLFAMIFGDEWRRAGVLVAWMTPCFIMQFLASTTSMALHVTNNQKTALILQIFGLVLRVGAVYGTSILAGNFVSEAYALSGFVFYFVYIIIVMNAVKAGAVDVMWEVRKGLPLIVLWSAFGFGVAFVVNAVHSLWLAPYIL
jgi:O-antigen/teichoic acid export membrane protein